MTNRLDRVVKEMMLQPAMRPPYTPWQTPHHYRVVGEGNFVVGPIVYQVTGIPRDFIHIQNWIPVIQLPPGLLLHHIHGGVLSYINNQANLKFAIGNAVPQEPSQATVLGLNPSRNSPELVYQNGGITTSSSSKLLRMVTVDNLTIRMSREHYGGSGLDILYLWFELEMDVLDEDLISVVTS
jgi:hypothetical protein